MPEPLGLSKGWLVFSADRRIQHRTVEWNAFLAAQARVFFLRAKNLRGSEQAELFVEQLPKIRALAAQTARPFIAQVTKTKVEPIEDMRRAPTPKDSCRRAICLARAGVPDHQPG